MTYASQFAGSGSVPLGGYAAFNPSQGNVITQIDGTVFLKGGVIAPAATYPTVPSSATAYLNPLAPVSTIGSGGRWVSIAVSPTTGYPLVLSDSPKGLYTIIYGLSSTSSSDCSTVVYGVNTSVIEGNYAWKYNKVLYHNGFLSSTLDSSLVTNITGWSANYTSESNILSGYGGNNSSGNALNAIASNPGGNIVWFYNASASTCLYGANASSNTSASLPSTGIWSCCAWGSNVFVALRNGATAAASSADGITWTARTTPSAAAWSSVASSGTLFVAVSSGGTAAASSADGITWTARTLPVSANWSAVTYSSALSLWCAVASDSSIAATSPDGITWTQRTLPASAYWADVKWSSALAAFITVASDGLAGAAFSKDGITWATKAMPRAIAFSSVLAAGSNTFYAIGDTSGFSTSVYSALPVIAKSVDNGLTWKYYRPNIALGNGSAFVYADSGFKYGGGRIYCAWTTASNANIMIAATSTDGITWSSATVPNASGYPYNAQEITYNGTYYFLITQTSSATSSNATSSNWYSGDGLNYTARTTLPTGANMNWYTCTAVGSVLLVASVSNYNGTLYGIYRSTDNGATWTSVTVNAYMTYPQSMVYDAVRDIVTLVGNTGAVAFSIDKGLTWTNSTGYQTGSGYANIYSGWVAGGNNTYTAYIGSTAYTGTSPMVLGNTSDVYTATSVLPYSYITGYNIITNRGGYNLRGMQSTSYAAIPQIQSGVNYYTDGYTLLKMDPQNYVNNTQAAGERSGYTSATVLSYYMRVK